MANRRKDGTTRYGGGGHPHKGIANRMGDVEDPDRPFDGRGGDVGKVAGPARLIASSDTVSAPLGGTGQNSAKEGGKVIPLRGRILEPVLPFVHYEEQIFRLALRESGDNIAEAARRLDVSTPRVRRMIEKYNILLRPVSERTMERRGGRPRKKEV